MLRSVALIALCLFAGVVKQSSAQEIESQEYDVASTDAFDLAEDVTPPPSSSFTEFFPLPTYEAKSAATKFNLLWSRITSTQGQGVPFSASEDKFFAESMLPVFDHDGDLMPDGRGKEIHTGGVVGRISLQITNHVNYTGIFSSGCDYGLMRFSSKGPPNPPNDVFIPAFAVKCLRDHQPSANMFGQRGVMLETTKTAAGFFSHPWTSHLPLVGAGDAAKAIRQKFTEVSQAWPSAVGSVSVAKFDSKGKSPASVHFPWQLIWVETPQLTAAAKKYSQAESVTVYDQIIALSHHLPLGTPLFDLYVQENNNSTPVKLGQLIMRSQWFKSTFADRYLFFKHTRVPDDLVARPDLNVCPLDISCTNWCPETVPTCAVWNTSNAYPRTLPRSSGKATVHPKGVKLHTRIGVAVPHRAPAHKAAHKTEAAEVDDAAETYEEEPIQEEEEEVELPAHHPKIRKHHKGHEGCPFAHSAKEHKQVERYLKDLQRKIEQLEDKLEGEVEEEEQEEF